MIAAFFYLLLGEFYLAAHWGQWTHQRSGVVFAAVLASAYFAVRAGRAA